VYIILLTKQFPTERKKPVEGRYDKKTKETQRKGKKTTNLRPSTKKLNGKTMNGEVLHGIISEYNGQSNTTEKWYMGSGKQGVSKLTITKKSYGRVPMG